MALVDVLKIYSASEFLSLSDETLYANESEYSLLLGLCQASAQHNTNMDLFYVVKYDSQSVGFCFISDRGAVLSKMPNEAVRALVDQLYFDHVNFTSVVGPVSTTEVFAKTWAGVTEKNYRIGMSQKIYEIRNIISPKAVMGQLIVACREHQDLITEWIYEFSLESLPLEINTIERAREFAIHKISKGEVFLWLSESGTPVSMNSVGRPTKNGISVSAVYTPIKHRKNGFASAVVAGTSQRMLDQGKKFCVLYTDLANPTSNKIYQDIGYQGVANSVMYIFA